MKKISIFEKMKSENFQYKFYADLCLKDRLNVFMNYCSSVHVEKISDNLQIFSVNIDKTESHTIAIVHNQKTMICTDIRYFFKLEIIACDFFDLVFDRHIGSELSEQYDFFCSDYNESYSFDIDQKFYVNKE